MKKSNAKRVWILVNPRSGLRWSFDRMRKAVDRVWDVPGNEVSYQFCQSVDDGVAKAQRAVERGVDVMLVVGGDGTVNTIGRTLIGTDVALGIVPVGSGNGFARHFEIPLLPERAVEVLASATVKSIDVGVVGKRPFLVTCSMAWEAAIAESFARSPVRGFIPYLFAGVQEFLDYVPQDFTVILDGQRELSFRKPMLFTVANLSQYGGGAQIAPDARADDGHLELVVALRQDIARLIGNIGRLFNGSLSRLPQVKTHRFRTMTVRRMHPAAIQVDGELLDAPAVVDVRVHPASLKVLVPSPP
ncbi:MAG: diacylglycerol kinase family lipid kinase [Lentisphaerae bacterium]|nr:diacylglycerol kinase family lipid kinase [Lentisphaerota bacterium]